MKEQWFNAYSIIRSRTVEHKFNWIRLEAVANIWVIKLRSCSVGSESFGDKEPVHIERDRNGGDENIHDPIHHYVLVILDSTNWQWCNSTFRSNISSCSGRPGKAIDCERQKVDDHGDNVHNMRSWKWVL
jgi:hypothetical protein